MNRKKGFLSAGALFMGLVVVLGLMGIVSGLWSKNLVIHGTVSTGDLNADWNCGYTNDDGSAAGVGPLTGPNCLAVGVSEGPGDDGRDPISPGNPWGTQYPSNLVRKDVGECHLTIDPNEPSGTENFGAQVALLELTNAYPSYECTFTIYLSNTGSIPFNIAGAMLDVDPTIPVEALPSESCGAAIQQVDPGEELVLSCTVHVMQAAAQNDCTGTSALTPWVIVTETCEPNGPGNYSAAVKVCVAQWNEAATLAECVSSPQHEGPVFGP